MKIIHIKDELPMKPSEFATDQAIIFYESLQQFQNKTKNSFGGRIDFADKKVEKVYNSYKLYSNVSFINAGVPSDKELSSLELINNGVKEFHSLELAEQVKKKISDKLKIEIKTVAEEKKMKYNSLGRGVFSFDRAAQGLCRVYDFFSVKHQKFVDETLVEKIGENEFVLVEDGSVVERRAQITESGQPKVRTTAKKVWVNFEKDYSEKKKINIVCNISIASNENSERLMYVGAYLSVLSEYYENKNYEITIFSTLGVTGKSSDAFVNVVKIKNSTQKVDFNSLMIATGDVRFVRTALLRGVYLSWKGLKRANIPSNLGYPVDSLNIGAKTAISNEIDPQNKELTLFIGSIKSLENVMVKHNQILTQIEEYEQRTANNNQ